eukprot:753522-Hanusia_phi.AAC.5
MEEIREVGKEGNGRRKEQEEAGGGWKAAVMAERRADVCGGEPQRTRRAEDDDQHVSTTQVKALYILMGRDLLNVQSVPAGLANSLCSLPLHLLLIPSFYSRCFPCLNILFHLRLLTMTSDVSVGCGG